MKIRNGFVSNSSSSSFIISFSKEKIGKKCKCCGVPYPDILSMVSESYNSTVEYHSREALLDSLNQELSDIKKKINEYRDRDPEDIIMSFPSRDFKVKDELDHYKRSYDNIKEQVKKIKNVDKKLEVAQISISYYDSSFWELVELLEDVKIIDQEEN